VSIGHQPIFVDLDIGQGSITIPGMIAAAPIDRPIDVEVRNAHNWLRQIGNRIHRHTHTHIERERERER
jgi:polynucleotide 5'-kinase involved in rRNA processing